MMAARTHFPCFLNAPPPQSQDQEAGATSLSLIAGANSPGEVGWQGAVVAGEGTQDEVWHRQKRLAG